MNITDIASANACPLDGRRTTTELLVKLFVVHFTTITAFCHVQSIRNETIVGFKLLFYLVEPLMLLAYHAVCLLALAIAAAITLFNRSIEHRAALQRAPLWLYGHCPKAQYQRLGNMLDPPRKERRTMKTLGRLVLATSLLVQCIGTIVLYRRRRVHDALTHVDYRVFELGCSGIVTALLWLCTELSIWPSGTPIPEWEDLQVTAIDTLMWYVRDARSGLGPCKHRNWIAFLQNSILAFLALIVTNKFRYAALLANQSNYYLEVYWNRDGALPDGLALEGTVLSFVGPISMAIGLYCGSFVFGFYLAKRVSQAKFVVPAVIVAFVASGIIGFMLGPLLLFFMAFIPDLVVFVREWFYIVAQIHAMNSWPVNVPCPLMWSDPAANWLWALA